MIYELGLNDKYHFYQSYYDASTDFFFLTLKGLIRLHNFNWSDCVLGE